MPPLNPLQKKCLALAISQSLISTAQAATIQVNNDGDAGVGCTLREAIASANTSVNQSNGCAVGSDSGIDRIVFSSAVFSTDSTITLNNSQLYLDNTNVEITAESVGSGVSINANGKSRVMHVNDGNVILENITLTGGKVERSSVNDYFSESAGGGLLIESSATVSLNNSKVHGNQAQFGGGGIFVSGSQLTLNDSVVTNNAIKRGQSSEGGGIALLNDGFLELNHSEITRNTVEGSSFTVVGGISAGVNNTLVIKNSSISNNDLGGIKINRGSSIDLIDSVVANNTNYAAFAAYGAGGQANIIRSNIINNSTSYSSVVGISEKRLSIVDSTISDNTSRSDRGTLVLNRSNGIIQNSTVSNNTLNGQDGFASFARISRSQITMNHVTAVGNQLQNETASYFGLYITGADGSVSIQNSIISNPTPAEGPYAGDCFVSQIYDTTVLDIDASTIIEDGSCGASRSSDPGVLELANNGGPTSTHALAPNSIAINMGDTSTCLTNDQRGAERDAQCDVGAFEFGVTVASISLSLLPDSIPENGGASTGTVSRTEPLDAPLTITLQSSDVSTVTVPSSVLIPAGEASAEFAINAVDDFIADGDTATTISASANNFVDSSASVTVVDNEVASLGLVLQANTVAENSGELTATLTRNTPITDALTVPLTVGLGSSATSRVSVPASVTIPAGESSTTVTITVLDNQIVDGTGRNTITASADGLLSSSADLNITDNDVAMLTVSVSTDSVAEEGGLLAGTVTRNTPSTDALAVTLSSSDTSSITVPALINIAAGQTMATFDISVVDNLIADGDRISTISASANGLANGTANVTVIDNEVAALNLKLSADNVAEDSGTLTATLSHNTPSQNAVNVALSSSDTSNVALPANATIPIGQRSVSFNVTVVDDSLVDGDSINTITATAVGLLGSSADVTVIDNDVPTLSLSVPSNSVSENSRTLLATLSRNTSTAESLTVTLSSSNTNHLTVPANATFAVDESSTTFEISVVDDSIATADSLTTISASENGFIAGNTEITVIDNEALSLALAFAQSSLVEGDRVLGRLSRNTPTINALTVTLASSAPAVASVDQTVQIPAGSMFTEFEVASIDNQVIDSDRRVSIVASDASGALTNSRADLTVLDNDDNDGDNIANNVDNCPAISNNNQANLDGDQFGDACDSDIDGDGMPNGFEQANGLNPRNAADANADNDGDGFSSLQEFQFGSDPIVADVDENNNGIPDATEVSEFNVAPILFLLLSDDER